MKRRVMLSLIATYGILMGGCRSDELVAPRHPAFTTENRILWSRSSDPNPLPHGKSTDGLRPNMMIMCDDTGYCAEDEMVAPRNDPCWDYTHDWCSTGNDVTLYVDPGDAAGLANFAPGYGGSAFGFGHYLNENTGDSSDCRIWPQNCYHIGFGHDSSWEGCPQYVYFANATDGAEIWDMQRNAGRGGRFKNGVFLGNYTGTVHTNHGDFPATMQIICSKGWGWYESTHPHQ